MLTTAIVFGWLVTLVVALVIGFVLGASFSDDEPREE